MLPFILLLNGSSRILFLSRKQMLPFILLLHMHPASYIDFTLSIGERGGRRSRSMTHWSMTGVAHRSRRTQAGPWVMEGGGTGEDQESITEDQAGSKG